jgi:hypothetical protein
MIDMRILTLISGSGAAVAAALLTGCSGAPAVTPPRPQSVGFATSQMQRVVNAGSDRRFGRFDACPTNGAIEYISDTHNGVINIYDGKFHGQSPCGQIVDYTDLASPTSMFVEASTHDLYVANSSDVLVFHRGGSTPYNFYYDPSWQNLVDVTVAKDGTVIAANSHQVAGLEEGSVSTWTGGPNGGTFVGNFPIADCYRTASVTVQKYGNVYVAGVRRSDGNSELWTSRCPHGACRPFVMTGAEDVYPGGLRSGEGEDLLWADALGGELAVYESVPHDVLYFYVPVGGVYTFDINRSTRDIFYAAIVNGVPEGVEATLPPPTSTLVGMVPFNKNGVLGGVAVDPPGGL